MSLETLECPQATPATTAYARPRRKTRKERRAEVEDLLRELAFVLKMTRQVKNELAEEHLLVEAISG